MTPAVIAGLILMFFLGVAVGFFGTLAWLGHEAERLEDEVELERNEYR